MTGLLLYLLEMSASICKKKKKTFKSINDKSTDYSKITVYLFCMNVPKNSTAVPEDKYDNVIKCVMEILKSVEMHFLYMLNNMNFTGSRLYMAMNTFK